MSYAGEGLEAALYQGQQQPQALPPVSMSVGVTAIGAGGAASDVMDVEGGTSAGGAAALAPVDQVCAWLLTVRETSSVGLLTLDEKERESFAGILCLILTLFPLRGNSEEGIYFRNFPADIFFRDVILRAAFENMNSLVGEERMIAIFAHYSV